MDRSVGRSVVSKSLGVQKCIITTIKAFHYLPDKRPEILHVVNDEVPLL